MADSDTDTVAASHDDTSHDDTTRPGGSNRQSTAESADGSRHDSSSAQDKERDEKDKDDAREKAGDRYAAEAFGHQRHVGIGGAEHAGAAAVARNQQRSRYVLGRAQA